MEGFLCDCLSDWLVGVSPVFELGHLELKCYLDNYIQLLVIECRFISNIKLLNSLDFFYSGQLEDCVCRKSSGVITHINYDDVKWLHFTEVRGIQRTKKYI